MNSAGSRPPSIVIMGPAGCGKTTMGQKLAGELGRPFVDADAHHSAANVEKMRAGIGLSDDDRAPWLRHLRTLLEGEQPIVLACSALKGSYRTVLGRGRGDVVFVYLKVPRGELEARLSSRTGHFAGAKLLDGQLDALEEPHEKERGVITVSAVGAHDDVLRRVKEGLALG